MMRAAEHGQTLAQTRRERGAYWQRAHSWLPFNLNSICAINIEQAEDKNYLPPRAAISSQTIFL